MDDEEVYEDDQQRFEAEVQQWQQQEQHEDEQMLTKKEFLNELVKKNHLVDEDIFPLPYGKKVSIITRTGIEKIQYHNNIDVTFSIESIDPNFIVIKAIAKKGDVQIETHGEASPQNTTQKYPVAMAEKRALSRVVLKICGAYQHGIFGEEESEDFKRKPSHHTDFGDDIRGPDTKQDNSPHTYKKKAA